MVNKKRLNNRFLAVVNYLCNLVIGHARDVPYNVHFTSRVIEGGNLWIECLDTNSAVLKSLRSSPGCYLNCINGIYLGKGVLLGPKVSIISANHQINGNRMASEVDDKNKVVIGNDVWIGAGSIILPGVHIGENCVIAAGSVVTKRFGKNLLLGGNPAKIIQRL